MNAFKLEPTDVPSTASQTSARAARNGKQAEDIWNISHERCFSMGIAFVLKIDPKRVIAKGQHIFVAKAGADYRGVILDGTNREIAAEAKSTVAASLDLTDERGGLLPNQIENLARVHTAGGIAHVLMLFRTKLRLRTFVLPWDCSKRGTRVCKLSDPDFTRHEIDPGAPYLKADYRVER